MRSEFQLSTIISQLLTLLSETMARCDGQRGVCGR
jgi:hypothetical protein